MSAAGSILAMITSLKNNARKKRKAFGSWERDKNLVFTRKKSLSFKTIEYEELRKIKYGIRKKIQDDRKISTLLIVLFLLPILFLLAYSAKVMISNNKLASEKIEKERIIQANKNKEAIENAVLYYLNDGYKWLSEGNFKNAKFQFYEAYKVAPNDFRVILANAKVYVHSCLENPEDCETANKMIQKLEDRYGTKTEIQELKELLKTAQ